MKNSLRIDRTLALALVAVASLMISGCATCKPGRPGPIGQYDIQVNLDQSLKSSSVLVDLVGVNAASLPRWEAYSMSKYWREDDPMRKDADKKPLNFVSGQTVAQALAGADAQWAKWRAKGVTHVLVLADLPGAHVDKPGNQDARRQILALDQCAWPDNAKALAVMVQKSGIDVLTPPRAAK